MKGLGTRVLSGVVAVLAIGCGTANLRVAETSTIRLTTDDTPARARLTLTAMARDEKAIVEGWFPCADAHQVGPFEVVSLADPAAFQRLAGSAANMGGRFITYPARVVDRPATLALHRHGHEDPLQVFRHELTHRLIAVCMPQAPMWLHEGFAELMETASVADGQLTVGLPHWFFDDIGHRHVLYGGTWATYVPRDRVLTVEALRAIGRGGVFTEGDVPETEARYASAWALVAVLATGPDALRRAFHAYLRELMLGTEEEAAWERHLRAHDVQGQLTRFVESNMVTFASVSVSRVEPPDVREPRALGAAETDLFWARHLRWDTTDQQREALGLIDSAERRDPTLRASPQAASLRAAVLSEAADFAGALRALEVVADPMRVAFTRAAVVLMHQEQPGEPARVVAAQHTSLALEDVEVLGRMASSPFEHDIVARAWLQRGDAARALAAAHTALNLDAACGACWVTLGRAAILRGELQNAARAVRRGSVFLGVPHGGDHWTLRAARVEYELAGARECVDSGPPRELGAIEQPTSRGPALDADAIRLVIRARLGRIAACRDVARVFFPGRQGTVTARFEIEPDGTVGAVTTRDEFGSEALACCVQREVWALQFPPPAGGGRVAVTYPFSFMLR